MNLIIKKRLLSSLACASVLPVALSGCGGGDDSSSTTTTAGNYTLTAQGGLGGAGGGSGGSGEYVNLYKESGTGDIEILRTGKANASFTSQTPSANLGDNPLTFTADTTINVVDTEPAAGTPYLVANSTTLRISDGDTTLNNEDAVTGLNIANGVTLTLALNYATYSYLNLSNDVINSGTITTEDDSATARGGLRLYPASYIGKSSSSIDTSASQDSQSGGHLIISADYSIYNHGEISTFGADSAAGSAGDGGYVDLNSEYLTQNTGDINSYGGNATVGSAGNGGSIDLEAYYSHLHNSGDINNSGGNGPTGGNGDDVYFYAYMGNLLNSGDINSSGGSSSAADGGSAGDINYEVYGGKLINSGNLTAMGGDTTNSASDAGNGNNVYFYSEYGSIYEYTPANEIVVSGNINTSGGNAVSNGTGDGGDAGYIDVEHYSYDYPTETGISFLGYTDINTSGGDGNYGGSANGLFLYNDYVWSDTDIYVPGGNVTNEANLTAKGGNVVAIATTTPANGGSGGDFYLETEYNYGYMVPELEKVRNSGNADLSGGDSLESTTSSTGRSGYVWFWGYNGVDNSGTIVANGGNDLGDDGGTTGYGNYANEIEFYAELGPVRNSANLTNNGGNGEYRGGRSNGIELYGPTVSNSGSLSSNGGNATVTLANSLGGSGGWIELYSPDSLLGVNHSGTISHTAGIGESINGDGAFIKGGMCISGDC